jgi:hypothetical protein
MLPVRSRIFDFQSLRSRIYHELGPVPEKSSSRKLALSPRKRVGHIPIIPFLRRYLVLRVVLDKFARGSCLELVELVGLLEA